MGFFKKNVQMEESEGPDIIKTDGSHIFVVLGSKFFVDEVKDGIPEFSEGHY